MFFNKKSEILKPKLEEAIKLVDRATRLASSYLYEKDYEPTEAEIALLVQLVKTSQQAHSYIGYISQVVQKKDMPESQRSVLSAYTSP